MQTWRHRMRLGQTINRNFLFKKLWFRLMPTQLMSQELMCIRSPENLCEFVCVLYNQLETFVEPNESMTCEQSYRVCKNNTLNAKNWKYIAREALGVDGAGSKGWNLANWLTTTRYSGSCDIVSKAFGGPRKKSENPCKTDQTVVWQTCTMCGTSRICKCSKVYLRIW